LAIRSGLEFFAPGTIAEQLPAPAPFLLVWLAGGLYALLGAISVAELGAMIPRSGGQYVFARYALGEYAGFIVGWSDWISSRVARTAAVALVIGTFSEALIPALEGKSCWRPPSPSRFFSRCCNGTGLFGGSNVQNLTSLVKALAFVALIVAAFHLRRSRFAHNCC
jgi:APA family basic amino acid/polyamine antiporter